MAAIQSVKDLETFLDYDFQNPKIVEDARRRKAFLNENPAKDNECMDSLATIGDAVLDLVALARLYELGERTKGGLTEFKSRQVKRKITRDFAERNNLFEYIQWGQGELKQKNWMQGVTRRSTQSPKRLLVLCFLMPNKVV
jgi:dsRNA-specific ribonuclease